MSYNKYKDAEYKFTAIANRHLVGVPIDTCYIAAVQGASYRGIGKSAKERIENFVNEMPVGGVVYDGYLLYDLDTELFAGVDGKWEKRVKNILIDGGDVSFPAGEAVPRFSVVTLQRLGTGDEVVLVPCKSHVAAIDDDLFIYQEFDWHRAFGLKSRSGKLSIM